MLVTKETAHEGRTWKILSQETRDIAFYLACCEQTGKAVTTEILAHFMRLEEEVVKNALKDLADLGVLRVTDYRTELNNTIEGIATVFYKGKHQWTPEMATLLLNLETSNGHSSFIDEPHYYLDTDFAESILEQDV